MASQASPSERHARWCRPTTGPHDKTHARGIASAEASQNLFTQKPVSLKKRQPERLRAELPARSDSANADRDGRAQLKRIKPQRRRAARFGASERAAHRNTGDGFKEMPKEMIVSVNGREKKIAIIENGRVTEFYIERGESSQGIVGNIYKGRVMRVLPGMQSAFVDIGLERDAFLYVSDFFDEEEEFERIVVDKKKTEGADDESAQRAAAERIERQRVERERRVEQAQEEAEPAESEG
ncbi:MAG: hypothetical protein DMF65_04385, partial [Acidobacteria bacterium]